MTTRKALLVGVESCPAADLHGPGNDVILMQDVLVSCFGFAVDTVPNRIATREGILDALDRFVGDATADDSLFFYFAGHGTRVPAMGHDDEEAVREAVCPHDFAVDDESKAIRDDELHARFVGARARGARFTAIFDCCFAGGLPRTDTWRRAAPSDAPLVRSIPQAVRARGRIRGRPVRVFRMGDVPAMRTAGPGAVVFGACVADGLAREQRFGDEIRGVFTHHLAAALRAAHPGVTNVAVRDAVREAVQGAVLAAGVDTNDVQRAIMSPISEEATAFLP